MPDLTTFFALLHLLLHHPLALLAQPHALPRAYEMPLRTLPLRALLSQHWGA
jgi:hypothetical protein